MGEIEIDEAPVRALLREQHPDLAELQLRKVDGGWANQQWRLGEELAVRMPPTARAPSLWTIARWVISEPVGYAPITRSDAACALAEFLKALHGTGPQARRLTRTAASPWQSCKATSTHGSLSSLTGPTPTPRVTCGSGPSRLPHGRTHRYSSTAICIPPMSWSATERSPASAWLLLPAGTAPRFFAAHAIADGHAIQRARGWAVLHALHLIGIGQNGILSLPGGKPTWEPAGRAALERVLA